MTPSYDIETRTMYFSSDGYPSLGGLDIFKVPGEKSRWKKAENMGYPLNSSADDLYYTISKDRSEGFFVSNRPGGVALKNPTCCDDIYSLKWTKYIRVALAGKVFQVDDSSKVESIEQILQKGSNADQEKFKPVERAVVSLFLLDPSGEEEPMFIKSDTTDANGDYSITMEQGQDYRVTISKDEYLSRSNNFSTKSFTKSDTLKWNAPIVAIPPEPIIIRNIYYHFDKSNLTDSAMMTIDTTIYRIMTENPEIVAEISSHTDSRGTDTYNEKLSQKRAESVVKYLISKGIASERLKAKGYGESKPLAPNENPDGSDNPEGRAKNRRTEFKVIGRIKNVSDVNYKE
ncbi:MAG: OmpA family protein [Flavobacteriales bacterium]|nr:OmpA family protein [Flavobacteriales bacterium]MCB9446763.1 OmpA family protein [Flavobacteriales bacterium]